MSDESLDDLLAQLGGGTEEEKTPEVPEEPETPVEEVTTPETVEEPAKEEEDPLAGLLVGETDEPKPEPVPEPAKKRRGRPKGSTAKAKTPAVVEEVETVEAEEVSSVESTTPDAVVTEEVVEQDAVGGKDIYLVTDAQIFNGHVYRRGQKITFVRGDKFYQSQTDRHGNNWLDHVDDPAYQFAYFGKLIVKPDHWDETPIGSTDGINHPGLALALARIAQEEHERNGAPYN